LQFRIERLAIRHAGRIAPPRNKDVVDYYRTIAKRWPSRKPFAPRTSSKTSMK